MRVVQFWSEKSKTVWEWCTFEIVIAKPYESGALGTREMPTVHRFWLLFTVQGSKKARHYYENAAFYGPRKQKNTTLLRKCRLLRSKGAKKHDTTTILVAFSVGKAKNADCSTILVGFPIASPPVQIPKNQKKISAKFLLFHTLSVPSRIYRKSISATRFDFPGEMQIAKPYESGAILSMKIAKPYASGAILILNRAKPYESGAILK